MTKHRFGDKVKRSIHGEMAALIGPLSERLSRWRLTGGILEYIYIKLLKRDILHQIQIIKSAPSYQHGDTTHLTFLELELAEIKRVENGERSVAEYNRLCEVHGAWRGLASSRVMVRVTEIGKQTR